MSTGTKQFLQFIAATTALGLAGNAVAIQNWPQSYALPFGLLWIFLFLVVTGFIAAGKEGAKTLLSMTLLMWALAVIGSLLITWLAIAGAGHSL